MRPHFPARPWLPFTSPACSHALVLCFHPGAVLWALRLPQAPGAQGPILPQGRSLRLSQAEGMRWCPPGASSHPPWFCRFPLL